MIEILLYLTTSRPGIAYAVDVCAYCQSDPHVSHLIVVKRILKYVHVTCAFGIIYLYDTNSTLVGYCDTSWVRCSDDRKSTLGGCFFLGINLISWFSNKQNNVSLSTAKNWIYCCRKLLYSINMDETNAS